MAALQFLHVGTTAAVTHLPEFLVYLLISAVLPPTRPNYSAQKVRATEWLRAVGYSQHRAVLPDPIEGVWNPCAGSSDCR